MPVWSNFIGWFARFLPDICFSSAESKYDDFLTSENHNNFENVLLSWSKIWIFPLYFSAWRLQKSKQFSVKIVMITQNWNCKNKRNKEMKISPSLSVEDYETVVINEYKHENFIEKIGGGGFVKRLRTYNIAESLICEIYLLIPTLSHKSWQEFQTLWSLFSEFLQAESTAMVLSHCTGSFGRR